MIHLRASRLLGALPDETLPEAMAADVRKHAAGCARCRRRLDELELCEALLQQMPTAILSLEWKPITYTRLVALARWSEDRVPPPLGTWRGPVLSVAGVLVGAILAIAIWSWAPVMAGTSPVDLAFVPSDSVSLPVGWRPGH